MFEYLKPYVDLSERKKHENNSFYTLKGNEIADCENYLGYLIPSQLKQFYKEIGYGFLIKPHKCEDGYKFYNTNRINSPDLMVEMLEHGQSSGLISEDAYELLQPGDLPFFEIGDRSSFMFMKTKSDNPNAVWYMGAIKIEDSLEKFIHNLYYKGAAYYADNW